MQIANHDFEVCVETGPGLYASEANTWDDLVGRSFTNSVFLRAAWLEGWRSTHGRNARLVTPLVYLDDRLVAAAALEHVNGTLRFAARGYADYADFVVDGTLDDVDYYRAVEGICEHAMATTGARQLELTRLPSHSRSVAALDQSHSLHLTQTASVQAPQMSMDHVADRLRKKSIVRHARKLAKLGELECKTTSEFDIANDAMESFFDLHVRRWQSTPTPSLFNQDSARAFYKAIARNLADIGCLRFSTVRLDGRLVAAHFGMMHEGVFTFYKPAFEIELAKLSPGEVMLKHLFEQARDECAQVFDFTIGDEPYKFRFATSSQEIIGIHVTKSRSSWAIRQARSAIARRMRASG
jgi:CelD/BcsL family acetyltransferase involved in cellulose biosynthesis